MIEVRGAPCGKPAFEWIGGYVDGTLGELWLCEEHLANWADDRWHDLH